MLLSPRWGGAAPMSPADRFGLALLLRRPHFDSRHRRRHRRSTRFRGTRSGFRTGCNSVEPCRATPLATSSSVTESMEDRNRSATGEGTASTPRRSAWPRLPQVSLWAAVSGPGGGLVQGVAFDVDNDSKTLQQSIIHVWGTGRFTRILDVTLEGHSVVGAGIVAREVEGVWIRRVVARHFRNWGVLVDENRVAAVISNPPLVTDIDAAYVSWADPGASNGTAEACVWIGNTATVRRVRAHDCAWEGLWAGTSADHALFEDIRVTNIDIGVYVEHFAHSSTFRRLQIGPSVKVGLVCEWADPGWSSRPACVDNMIEESSFDTSVVGVYLDEGTTGTTVRESTFANQCWAAIGSYRGAENLDDTTGNDYRDLPAGAVPISKEHYSAIPCARP